MTPWQQAITIALVVLGTVLTRFLAFWIFPRPGATHCRHGTPSRLCLPPSQPQSAPGQSAHDWRSPYHGCLPPMEAQLPLEHRARNGRLYDGLTFIRIRKRARKHPSSLFLYSIKPAHSRDP